MRTSSWPIGSLVRAGLALLLVGGVVACSSDPDSDSSSSSGSGVDSGQGTGASLAPSTSTTSTTTTAVQVVPAVDPVGTVTHGTLSFAGHDRTYRLYVPRSLPDGPVPLFIGLHGGLGWGDQFATTDHVEGLAESNGFVVVHPDGVKVAESVGGGRGGVWNGGMCCGVAARTDVDDVGFIEALIDQVEADHDIDPHRVFAFGHSNGGIMSYRLACELADRIAGVGVVEGTLGLDGCAPSEPVSILQVHGTADRSLPLAGGAGTESLAGVDFPPPRDGFATLAAADGCPEPAEAAETTDGEVTTAVSEPCDDGTAAAFVTIEGGPHAYPGGTPAVRPRSGPGYPGYDATAEIVTFLLSHPRP